MSADQFIHTAFRSRYQLPSRSLLSNSTTHHRSHVDKCSFLTCHGMERYKVVFTKITDTLKPSGSGGFTFSSHSSWAFVAPASWSSLSCVKPNNAKCWRFCAKCSTVYNSALPGIWHTRMYRWNKMPVLVTFLVSLKFNDLVKEKISEFVQTCKHLLHITFSD
jgi:hypothetical protein